MAEKYLLQFRLFQYSLVIQIQGQTFPANKLNTELVKTNNPYGLYVPLYHPQIFIMYAVSTHRKDSRILENWKIEFQAGVMNVHSNIKEIHF